MGQKHGEWLWRLCQNYRPLLTDACVESLASTGLPLSATLTCGKLQGKHLWDKSWQAENGHGSATHLGLPCIARQALLWNPQESRRRGRPCNTWRRDTDHTMKSRGLSWHQLEGLCQWPMFRDGIIRGFRSDQTHLEPQIQCSLILLEIPVFMTLNLVKSCFHLKMLAVRLSLPWNFQ